MFNIPGTRAIYDPFNGGQRTGTLKLFNPYSNINKPIFDLTQTWNNAGITFTALKLNITNTASAAASLLFDFQIGGVSVSNLAKDGSQTWVGSAGTTFQAKVMDLGGGTMGFRTFSGGSAAVSMAYNGLTFAAGMGPTAISFTGFPYFGQDANQILAISATTSPTTLRIYNTFTDASNYERGVIDWTTTANTLTIGAQAAGTGTLRSINYVGVTHNFSGSTSGNCIVGSSTSGYVFVSNGTASVLRSDTTSIGIVANNLAMGNSMVVSWNSGNTWFNAAVASISNPATKVVAFGDGAANANGWIQWGGQARVTSDFTVTSSTVLTNVTGLSVSLQAGRTYQFETELYVTDAAAGGVQAAIAGTATATAIQYTGYTIADNAIKGKTNATALATAVGSTTTTETAGIVVRITGTITVNAAGTLTVQMAQNTSNATATTAKRGSWFIVQDMP